MLYRVSKKVPLPATSGRGREPMYVFPDLEVGDSFVVTTNKERQAARKRYAAKNQKIVTRMLNDTCRIWRCE